jgi:hypothetical protein
MDTLTEIYFVSFVTGGGFAVASFVLGARGSHAHGHAGGHGGHGGGHAGPAHGGGHAGPAHGGGHAHAGGHGHAGGRGPAAQGSGGSGLAARLLTPFGNLNALAALACVGGGVGFFARRMGAGAPSSLVWASAVGLAAAYLVGGLMSYLQRSTEYVPPLDPSGTVGTVLHRIGEKGTGEIAYLHKGARATLPAVSANGQPVEAGTEVVVLDIQNGVARVAPSTDVFGEEKR